MNSQTSKPDYSPDPMRVMARVMDKMSHQETEPEYRENLQQQAARIRRQLKADGHKPR